MTNRTALVQIDLMMIFGVFIFVVQAASQQAPSAEMVRPDAYAIKRFQEVIEEERSREPISKQEKLITERAKLKLAEKKLTQLKTHNPPAKYTAIRAAEARVDHHRTRVERLEKQVKKTRRR